MPMVMLLASLLKFDVGYTIGFCVHCGINYLNIYSISQLMLLVLPLAVGCAVHYGIGYFIGFVIDFSIGYPFGYAISY